ncbi:MAG: CAP domain-containing protein [Lamprobacter sp.]|uniref:CAP domain-containing protein n=1 Tax=Lamprobacter sp. TaxID=3100796 RepID=UPI002B26234E|nr:CAP domain-containing protein [Lamprobacter sp.]MEA3640802.1 CAP domain-containing protein [Lamprobacter sp.]
MLELINRARSQPLEEAARYGIDLNQGLASGTLSGLPMQPVFSNSLLIDAAHVHSDWMLETNTFSHTGEGGSSPSNRMEGAGYQFVPPWSWGENLSWKGTTGTLPSDLTNYILNQYEGLFLSPGHRENILGNDFREIGIGQSLGEFTFQNVDYQTSMITQNFATSGDEVFLGGVVYDDMDRNRFYTPGEGLGGITVSLPDLGLETQTGDAGGYQLAVPAGTHQVLFSGAALEESETRTITIGDKNEKLDLVLGPDELPLTLDPVDYATRFMQALAEAQAEEAVALNPSLTSIFARILSRQLEPDSEEGGLMPTSAFDTLAPVLTFVASPALARPPGGPMGGYSPAAMAAAHDAARFEADEAGMQGFLAADPLDWEIDGLSLSTAFESASASSWDAAPEPDLPADDSGAAASLAAYADWTLL